MIIIITTNSESLHDLEFVKPIEKIIKENKMKSVIIHYSKLKNSDIKKSSKIIITGTSLLDNNFLKNLRKFRFLKNYKKPVLGICAGHQIISIIFGAKIKKNTEIGYYFENFEKNFLSLEGEHEVYHLHNNYTKLPKDFTSYTKSKIPQAIKHDSKDIYGVLFHPEVRNRKLIETFIKN